MQRNYSQEIKYIDNILSALVGNKIDLEKDEYEYLTKHLEQRRILIDKFIKPKKDENQSIST